MNISDYCEKEWMLVLFLHIEKSDKSKVKFSINFLISGFKMFYSYSDGNTRNTSRLFTDVLQKKNTLSAYEK